VVIDEDIDVERELVKRSDGAASVTASGDVLVKVAAKLGVEVVEGEEVELVVELENQSHSHRFERSIRLPNLHTPKVPHGIRILISDPSQLILDKLSLIHIEDWQVVCVIPSKDGSAIYADAVGYGR